ncbi:uncharacterized protein LOC111246195 isoform X2 [Varroa destructor]|uniref:Uncharacterized protein n=1 Tax=Varroa destructor TaxID=109461 RepID=A0A7M7MC32_VARDE|nr:uncharacterized protein LOC111246195 isoform X2 [Varroa destructor]
MNLSVGEPFVEKWFKAGRLEKTTLTAELEQSMSQAPILGWKLLHALRETLKTGDLDAACCTRIALTLKPALELLNTMDSEGTNDAEIILQAMIFFVTEFMTSVCLNEGPDLIYDLSTFLYETLPRTPLFVELVSALQSCIVDYSTAVPDNKSPLDLEKQVKFWKNGISYAIEVSRFNPRSHQVVTLCRSIAGAFFGGAKLASAIKKLNDMTGQVDKSRSDIGYLFDHQAVKFVKTFAENRGVLMGYSFLWALLNAFLLRLVDQKDYLSALMLLVHFLQAAGAPIKCMPTASILEYPQSELEETERLFHVVKLLEVYISSGMYHPSVLITTKKRFRGTLVFNDILMFIIKHPAKGSSDWYRGLLYLATVASNVVVQKLRTILQKAWFDCVPDDPGARDEFLIFLINMYDRMHKAAEFYTRFLGAINDYLETGVPEPSLSEVVLIRMRMNFCALSPDDVIKIWADYVRYLLQVLQKWKERAGVINKNPQTFILKVFAEFMQHCSLVPLMEITAEQYTTMDNTIENTLKLTKLLLNLTEEMPDIAKDTALHYVKISQAFIKCRFIRTYYLEGSVTDSGTDDATRFQEELVALIEDNLKFLRQEKALKLEVLCSNIKLSQEPKSRANLCLEDICANFDNIDWQSILCRHPQVVRNASKKKVEHFVALLFDYLVTHRSCTYVQSQLFRSDSRQVFAFVKLVTHNLAKVVSQSYPQMIDTLEINNRETPIRWKRLQELLTRIHPKTNLIDIVAKTKDLLTLVPVVCLPPELRLKLFGLTLIVILGQSTLTEKFLSDASYFFEDLSSAFKFKGCCDDSDLGSICHLATLCLDKVLGLDPSTCIQQSPPVKKVLDLIHFVQYTVVKRMSTIEPVQTIFKQFALQNDAEFCAALHLTVTLVQVHHKKVSAENIATVYRECKQQIDKALVKSAFKLQNMIYIASKYVEVFGVHDALRVQSIKLAFQSAGETILALQQDGTAMRLCTLVLRDNNSEIREVIPAKAAVFCALLVGGENESELRRTMDATLANELWPVLSSVMDDLQEISSFVESVVTDSSDVTFHRNPFRLETPLGVVGGDDILNRCLLLLTSVTKYGNENVVLDVIQKWKSGVQF